MRTLDRCCLKEIHCCKLWKIKKNIKKAVLKSREPPKFLLKKPKNVIKGCNLKNLWSRMWSCLEFRWFFAGIKIAVNTLYTRKSEKREKIKENRRFNWTSDFGLSDKTWTCGLYHPNSRLNVFLVILPFFRPFRYDKNGLSRSRTRLFPYIPNVVVVKHVVVIPAKFLRGTIHKCQPLLRSRQRETS